MKYTNAKRITRNKNTNNRYEKNNINTAVNAGNDAGDRV